MKPRITYNGTWHLWRCGGRNYSSFGVTPSDAYMKWARLV